MNKFITALVTFTIIVLLTALGYFIFQNQKLIGQLSGNSQSQTPAPTTSPTPSASPEPSPSPEITAAITQNAIKTNIAAKNYQGLIPYMEGTVQVVLQATECCGAKTPQEAIEQMTYINEGVPFNFDQNSETVKNLKSKNPEFSGKFIGISQSKEHLIAFGLNGENKIADIKLSVSWKLFNN